MSKLIDYLDQFAIAVIDEYGVMKYTYAMAGVQGYLTQEDRIIAWFKNIWTNSMMNDPRPFNKQMWARLGIIAVMGWGERNFFKQDADQFIVEFIDEMRLFLREGPIWDQMLTLDNVNEGYVNNTFTKYFDDWQKAGMKFSWLKVFGLAMLAWVQHNEK